MQPILKQCLDLLTPITKYQNSPRLLTLSIQYIEISNLTLSKQIELFLLLRENSIGAKLALFYQAYALLLEKNNQWEEADSVYMQGLIAQAEPLVSLIQHYDKFKNRLKSKQNESNSSTSSTSSFCSVPSMTPAGVSSSSPSATSVSLPSAAAAPTRGFDRSLLQSEDGEELSFEEVRAKNRHAAFLSRSSCRANVPSSISSLSSIKDSVPSSTNSARRPLSNVLTAAESSSPSTTQTYNSSLASPSDSSIGMASKILPSSPTICTKAAMLDVDAMFGDATSSLHTFVPPSSSNPMTSHLVTGCFTSNDSTAFVTRSLTSELGSPLSRSPAEESTSLSHSSRPSAVAFVIHEDTDLFPHKQQVTLTQPGDDEDHREDDEEEPVIQQPSFSFGSFEIHEDTELLGLSQSSSPPTTASSRSSCSASNSSGPVSTPQILKSLPVSDPSPLPTPSASTSYALSQYSTPHFAASSTSSCLLTPILETSRENDDSDLMIETEVFNTTKGQDREPVSRASRKSVRKSIGNLSTPSNETVNPFESSIQSLILKELGVLDFPMHYLMKQKDSKDPSGFHILDVDGLLDSSVTDLEVGDSWIRIESKLTSTKGRNYQKDKVAELFSVQNVDESCEYVMALYSPPFLWSFYIGISLIQRLESLDLESARLPNSFSSSLLSTLFSLPSTVHSYANATLLFSSPIPARTLDDILRCYSNAGRQLDESLSLWYCIEILLTLRVLLSCGIVHCGLNEYRIRLRGEELTTECIEAWTPQRQSGWERQGVTIVDLDHSIDLQTYPSGTPFSSGQAILDHIDEQNGHNEESSRYICEEWRKGKSWCEHPDLYSFAAVAFKLAFQTSMPSTFQELTKRYKDQRTGQWNFPNASAWQNRTWSKVFEVCLTLPPPSAATSSQHFMTPESLTTLADLQNHMEKCLLENDRNKQIKMLLCKQMLM